MEQFNLEKWLKDNSRKVVTRDGREVRILDYNLKGDKRICIAVDDKIQESITTVDEDGHCLRDKTGWHESNFDLFFADEEEELTEFEKELQRIISEASHWTSDDGSMSTYCHFGDKEIKKISGKIFDLARKKDWREPVGAYKNGYKQGKQDALKDLPKWKKAKKDEELDCHVAIQQDDRVVLSDFVQKDEYYITLDVLKILPKEE